MSSQQLEIRVECSDKGLKLDLGIIMLLRAWDRILRGQQSNITGVSEGDRKRGKRGGMRTRSKWDSGNQRRRRSAALEASR